MRTLIEVDTTDPADVRQAISYLQSVAEAGSGSPSEDSTGPQMHLPDIVERLLNVSRYGYNRLGYVARVAVCTEEDPSGAAPKGFVMEHFMNQEGNNPGQSLGATHRSLERSWEALGGKAFSEQFISTTPTGSHRMDSTVADAVRSYLGPDYIHDAVVQKLKFDGVT